MSTREDDLDPGTGDPAEGDSQGDGDQAEPRYSHSELLEMRGEAYGLASRFGNADESDVDLHEPGSPEDRKILEGFGSFGKTIADALEESARITKAHEEALAANALRTEDERLMEEAKTQLANERAEADKAAALERAKAKLLEDERAAGPGPEATPETDRLLETIRAGSEAAQAARRGEITIEQAHEITGPALEAAAQLEQLEKGSTFRVDRKRLDDAVAAKLAKLRGE
jgi:hypothetical protein